MSNTPKDEATTASSNNNEGALPPPSTRRLPKKNRVDLSQDQIECEK